MVLGLSKRAELLSSGSNIQSQLILKIDGIQEVFGALPVDKFPFLDDGLFLDDGHFLDTGVPDPDSRDWISLEQTTKRISQQIEIEGGTSSVTSMKIQVIDPKGQLTKILQPGNRVPDPLGRKAKVFLNFANGGTHPEDSVLLVSGIVSNLSAKIGSYIITVDHPRQLLRQKLYTNIASDLSSAIDDVQTTLTLESTNGMLEPADNVSTYIRIGDEIIEYTGISGNILTGLVRGSLGTTASAADAGTEASTRYRIQDNMIDLALKLMISGSGTYAEGITATRFNKVTATETIPNAVIFNGINIVSEYGLTTGDLLTISGSSNGNDFTEEPILSLGTLDNGSYAIVGVTLNDETESSATGSLRSRYDVYPQGCKMDPTLVDVAQHLFWKDIFSAQFFEYDFILDDEIEADTFLSEEVYFPQGAYALPRQGKASMNMVAPGLAIFDIPTLDLNNLKEPADIGLNRSINKYLYSSITYKYDPDILEPSKFRAGIITLDTDSQERIAVGNRTLTITSRGLRRGSGIDSLITSISRRFLERYRFAAQTIELSPFYGDTLKVEAGDTVLLDGTGLQLPDINTGKRGAAAKLYEAINISRDVIAGKTTISCLDVNFGLDGRFGVVSPSSFVASGSTTTRIRLKKSFGTLDVERETDKWVDFIFLRVLVHSKDHTYEEETRVVGIDSGSDSLIVETLSITPLEDYVIDIANYPDTTDAADQSKYKTQFCYFTPQIGVTAGTSGTEFTVDDPSVIQIGAFIEVSRLDYSLTGESEVTNLVGSVVTVKEDLGFTPILGDIANLHNFKDGGLPYRIF